MNPPAFTPPPPCYAVVFTSVRNGADDDEYHRTADRMIELATAQPEFLEIEHACGTDGVGITISYWDSTESIRAWQ